MSNRFYYKASQLIDYNQRRQTQKIEQALKASVARLLLQASDDEPEIGDHALLAPKDGVPLGFRTAIEHILIKHIFIKAVILT